MASIHACIVSSESVLYASWTCKGKRVGVSNHSTHNSPTTQAGTQQLTDLVPVGSVLEDKLVLRNVAKNSPALNGYNVYWRCVWGELLDVGDIKLHKVALLQPHKPLSPVLVVHLLFQHTLALDLSAQNGVNLAWGHSARAVHLCIKV